MLCPIMSKANGKLKKIWLWLRKNVLNKQMILYVLIAEAIFWSPCIVTALLAVIISPWWWTAFGAICAFWSGPLTPAIPLQIGLAAFIKKLVERKKNSINKKINQPVKIEELNTKKEEKNMNYLVLYNPYADNGNGKENAEILSITFQPDTFEYIDITTITDYKAFFTEIPLETNIVICGGDGTLNRFINATKSIRIQHQLFYSPCGNGNDFARDLGSQQELIPIREYIQALPVVCVNGKAYRFINGVGYGLDGYCCEVGDKIRQKKPKKKINYTMIALKGLLFHYRPTRAIVTVDGKKSFYTKVWIAPTMYGKYYGGGMMAAPEQQRNNLRGKVSVMVFHGCGRLKTLCLFPSIFKGTHVKHKKNVTVLSGQRITVQFQKPRALQIDGETIKNVSEYTVKSAYIVSDERRKQRLG